MNCLTKIYTVCLLVLEFSIKITWTRFSFLEILQNINFVVCFLVLKGFKSVSICRHFIFQALFQLCIPFVDWAELLHVKACHSMSKPSNPHEKSKIACL